MNKGHNVNSIPLLPLPMALRPQGNMKGPNEKGHIVLPPLSDIKFNNYTTIKLTERNLSNMNHSSPPSLTSSSASSSPASSPNLSNMNLSGMNSPVNYSSSVSATNIESIISAPSTATSEATDSRKRRQRLGPSCDSCRTRKVKCDAEISVLYKLISTANLAESYPPNIVASLLENKQVELDENTNIIISNDKLIRFKPCKSCSTKNLPCCFAKGFTKEDMMLNNKKKPSISSASLGGVSTKSKINKKKSSVSSLGSRKSSCNACRRRKIKCVYNDALNKCEGCAKKDHNCMFENIN